MSVVRRVIFAVAILSAILLINRQLSDGGRRVHGESVPPLWAEAVHADWPRAQPSHGKLVIAADGANPPENCAMVLSLDRDSPYRFTSVEDGVRFDIDGDGSLEQVSWTESGTDVAFLARDSNGDGRITDGRELIGDRTVPGVRNGPNALISLATRGFKGQVGATVDSNHPLLSRLLLWTDANHDGASQPAELQPAVNLVSTIGLGFTIHHRTDHHGNESRFRGFAHIRSEPGPNTATSAADDRSRRLAMYDVCLVVRP